MHAKTEWLEEHTSGSPLPELARATTTGAVRLAGATAAWLRLVAEFDQRGGWHGVGITSCGHWLAWQCGLSPGAGREHVRGARAPRGPPRPAGAVRGLVGVAGALRGLPRIGAAFAAGRLSYSKVRALTRIAAADCEAALLEFALSATASQTERFCRQWRRVDDDDGDPGAERRPEVGQSFDYWTDDEGYLTLKVRMPADAGAPRSWPRWTPSPSVTPAGNAPRTRRLRPATSGPTRPEGQWTEPWPSAAPRTRLSGCPASAPPPA